MKKILVITLIITLFLATLGCSILEKAKGNYKVSGDITHEVTNLLGDNNGEVKVTINYADKTEEKLIVNVTYENVSENDIEFGWLTHPGFELYDSNGNKAKTAGLLNGYDSEHKDIKLLKAGEEFTTQVEFYEVNESEEYKLLIKHKDEVARKTVTSSFSVTKKY
jgi:hypothetical protein